LAALAISVLLVLMTPAGAMADKTSSSQQQQSVQSDINNLNIQLAEAVQKYDEASAKLDDLNNQIDHNQQQLQETVRALVTASDILDKRAIGIYKRGSVSSLEVIFNSKNFGDFVQQLDLLSRIGDRDGVVVKQVEAQKKEVDAKSKQLDEQRKQQETMTNDLANQRDAIDQQLTDKTMVLASIIQDIANLDAAEAERVARERSKPGSHRGGAKLYDVIPGLSGYWSNGSGPLGPGEYSDHGPAGHGVWLGGDAFDLMCGDGVSVYAAHSGTVTEIGYGRGGWTVVSGEGYETCYAHSDPLTYVGQSVSAGENIAITGSGFEHLHFELIDNGEGVPAGDYASYF
jgi:murein DD-endopeptidase MepM/ murein hydrolase activator NlpD